MLKLYPNAEFKMQNSSPDTDPTGSSILYNDSGYFTNHNPEVNSLSSNSNSEPSFEVCEDVSLHSKTECLPLQSTSGIYFCEDAVFDEPKLEGPPLLCDTNNYEEFSSLIKFSLEETSNTYLVNDSNSEYYQLSQNKDSVLQYFNQDSLSSLSSINPSQPIVVSANKQNIVSQAVEECLTETITISDSETDCSQSVSNSSCLNNQVQTPEKTYTNTVDPNQSPELFSEDEDPIIEVETSTLEANFSQTQRKLAPNEQFLKNDRKLLKRVQETLNGVPPPPSVTILQISVSDMLEKIYSNKHLFLSVNKDETNEDSVENKCNLSNISCTEEKRVKSLLISSTKEEVDQNQWPEIMNLRYHGLYYNRSTVWEDIEQQCSRYLSRYVGCETASSCTAPCGCTGGAAHRRAQRARWAPRSPGRRLSHLARRRITFSSANLQQQSAANRLMIDARKTINKVRRSPRKSPWKKSPRKSPHKKIKTPNSSAKKRSATSSATSKMSSTKRALFQSPERQHTSSTQKPRRALFASPGHHPQSTASTASTQKHHQSTTTTGLHQQSTTCATSSQKSRRALFSSPGRQAQSAAATATCTTTTQKPRRALFSSPSKRSPLKKRKRQDEDGDGEPLKKLPRSLSFDVQRASGSGAGILRRNSEVIVRGKGELSDLHKQVHNINSKRRENISRSSINHPSRQSLIQNRDLLKRDSIASNYHRQSLNPSDLRAFRRNSRVDQSYQARNSVAEDQSFQPRSSQSSQPRSSVDRQPRNSQSSQPRNSQSSQPRNSLDRQPRNSIDRQPRNSLDRQSRNSIDRQPRTSIDRQPRNSIDRQPRNSIEPQRRLSTAERKDTSKRGSSLKNRKLPRGYYNQHGPDLEGVMKDTRIRETRNKQRIEPENYEVEEQEETPEPVAEDQPPKQYIPPKRIAYITKEVLITKPQESKEIEEMIVPEPEPIPEPPPVPVHKRKPEKWFIEPPHDNSRKIFHGEKVKTEKEVFMLRANRPEKKVDVDVFDDYDDDYDENFYDDDKH